MVINENTIVVVNESVRRKVTNLLISVSDIREEE